MINMFVLIIFFGTSTDHIVFPYRAECDYAAKQISENVTGAKAYCFDMRVAGDRHENNYSHSN